MPSFDINRGMENKKTSKLVKSITVVFSITIVVICLYLVFNGKHNKISVKNGIETAIPESKDTTSNVTNNTTNQKTEVNIKTNNGDIIIGK